MKRTDLEKNIGLKIKSQINRPGAARRIGQEAAVAVDRREQRKLDQALGLVPFAVKLNGDLVKRIHSLAQERQTGLNEMVAELLQKGLNS
jgi:hypothetical protein